MPIFIIAIAFLLLFVHSYKTTYLRGPTVPDGRSGDTLIIIMI